MSVKKEIFKTIGQYLMMELANLDGLPDLQWFDKQMGQFDNPETSYAIPLPCVLLEFGQFTWTTIGKNEQKGEGNIRAYVYFENYANSFAGSLNQELALQFFEFTEAVQVALQGLAIPDIMGVLERVGDAEDVSEDMVITSIMDYSTVIYDSSTNSTRNFIDVDPDVEVQKKKESSRPIPNTAPAFLTT